MEREVKKALGNNEEKVDTVQLWFQEERVYPQKRCSTSLCFGFIPSGEEEGKEHRILEVGFERDDDELSVEKKSFSSVNSSTYYNVEMLLFYCMRKARSRCLAAHRRLRHFHLCLALESRKRMDLMFCCCLVLFVCLFCFSLLQLWKASFSTTALGHAL